MAKKLSQQQEEEETTKIRLAVETVESDANLRFLFRAFLNAFGAGITPEGDSAHATSRAIGRHSCAMDIIATFNSFAPFLYPKLLTEDRKEQLSNQGDTYVSDETE